MDLARVIGTLVATQKVEGLEGVRFLVIQPIQPDGSDVGEPVIAADAIQSAGPGTIVWFTSSREAAIALPEPFVPVDAAIVGIVDQINDSGEESRP
ncbi:MAG: ethanolamine utilization protein EutN [Myxococcales bacterium]|nr:ethanolamine utilization protein EutN [Myxococcales bacterium]